MNGAERKVMLEALRSGPARVRTAVKGLAADVLDFRPFADAWTVRENIVHLCDAEVHAYSRYRKAIAEPGARVDVWDEIKWHATLEYAAVDASAGLALLEALRASTAALLDRIADAAWSAFRIEHPKRGMMDLEQMVGFFVEHDNFHLDLVGRNKRLWKEKKG